MKQVVIIHGGNSFNSYRSYLHSLESMELNYERLKPQQKWKSWIAEQMPDTDVLLPTFPNGFNAVYDEWKIYFEKLLPFLGNDVRLVGHSLGAMFLSIYLNEKPLSTPVRQLILISGAYDDETSEELGSFKVSSVQRLPESAQEIHLFHSKDDPVVPYAELAKYQAGLPAATTHSLTDRRHFDQPTFPELLELLKQK